MRAFEMSHFSVKGESLPKSIFGYEVIAFIGEGAGSLIYAVSHPDTHQLYALKHVVRKTDKHARFIEQLEREYEVSQHFSHPGLRASVDMKENRTFFRKVTEAVLVMELFDGTPLDVRLPGALPALLNIFIQTGKALGALHHSGYVHCDLKPNNILASNDNVVKVIDFGQACKVGTVKERIQGTPDFIAPEQVKCDPMTVRTDVFNFGATLYWSLCGKKIPTLFTLKKGDNSFLLDDKIATPAECNPRVPENLSNLAMECVRTNPARRPHDMAEVVRRLEIVEHSQLRKLSAPAPHSDSVVAHAAHPKPAMV